MSEPREQPAPITTTAATLRVSTSRAEAFSDGVLAIAITLLVLNLTIESEKGKFASELGSNWPIYLAYLSSFAYVGVIWLNHHAAFARIRYVDRGLNWANLGLLLGASLLPFPTAVMGDAVMKGNESDGRASVLLYAGLATFVSLSWLMFFHYLHTHPALVESHVPEGFFGAQRSRALIGLAAYPIAALIAVVSKPYLALAFFLILPIFYAITSEGGTIEATESVEP